MRTSALLCVVLAACSFTPSGGDEVPVDADTSDGGGPDAAEIDAATIDAAMTDAAEIDAATIDAAMTDAAEIDARVIDAAPPIDARPIDAAPPIDAPPMCPVGYTSGYRLITASLTWRAAETDCEDDSAGLTHLVVINTQPELDGINAAISTDLWVGVVRDPVVPDSPGAWRWRWVTGGPALFLPWEGGQPDNASGNQLVVTLMNSSGLLRDIDIGTSTARPALCECDRLPPVNADYLDP